jgi:ubiquinone/menaquinone biosynthesis C-methylase UbiE
MSPERAPDSVYDKRAIVYDRLWSRYIRRTHDELMSRVHLADDQHVLDVGCGTGVLAQRLAKLHPKMEIVGVDASFRMLVRARARLSGKSNVTFVRARAEQLPFPDASFDLILSASALHHFTDPSRAFREMRRLLADKGRIAVLDWCRESNRMRLVDRVLRIIDPSHVRAYTREEILEMASAEGLSVQTADKLEVRGYGMMVILGTRYARSVGEDRRERQP